MTERRSEDIIVHLTRMEGKIETIEERTRDTHRMVMSHDEILRGNGEPGLRSDVEMLKMAQHKRDKIIGGIMLAISLMAVKAIIGII